MPIHDWSLVSAGLFHHFHQRWSGSICDALNDGRLPKGYFALVEQSAIGLFPDVLTLERRGGQVDLGGGGATAVAESPPMTRFVSHAVNQGYAAKANRIVVRSGDRRVISVIEVVSPGNKSARHAIRSFINKSVELLLSGVNLLVIDLFPPSARDPEGIHPLIWTEIKEEAFKLPEDKPLTLASYVGVPSPSAYVEPIAVGDTLPDVPLFLDALTYVSTPLESTYQATWLRCPDEFREEVLNPSSASDPE